MSITLKPVVAADVTATARSALGLIEDNGAYQLSVNETGMYQISNGVGTPVVLKINTSDVGPRTLRVGQRCRRKPPQPASPCCGRILLAVMPSGRH